jgi:hypothetical protein
MKTAVSVPDRLFRLAETTARRMRVSRSELYAKAIAEFLERQHGNAIAERLNEVYSRRAARMDPGLQRAQLKCLEKDAPGRDFSRSSATSYLGSSMKRSG